VKVGKREDKEAKRGRKKKEDKRGRKKEVQGRVRKKKLRGDKERKENQFRIFFLFHQSLPPLEYKTHLSRQTNKP